MDEINTLEDGAGSLSLSEPSASIPEDQLFQRLEAARLIAGD
jgi:hypothetical protein